MEQIDILLATYNGEKYLEEQLDSIIKQTYSNFRLIISDDCSTDNTKNILQEYEKKDDRIIVYYQKENLGFIENFEFLLTKVESKYYALSDQDDIWFENKIEKEIEVLEKEDADLVFCDLEVVDENKQTMQKSFIESMNLKSKIKKAKDNKIAYLYNTVTGCTIVAKNKFMDIIFPIPNETKHLLHDHWIALMISIYGKVSLIDKPYIYYRQHSQNQIGVEKVSYKMEKFDDVRNLFLKVKLELFSTYVKNNNRFPKDVQEENMQALKYFEMVKNKDNFNFRKIGTFFKLYKYENFSYFVLNFIIINIPWLGRKLFKLKKGKK